MLEGKLIGYVSDFNRHDIEYERNAIDNDHACQWLLERAPRFECPDNDFERTFYFRLWTYRKHIKITPQGYIVSEFLPDVPWSGPYNIICAAAGHHIYEGRWFRGSEDFLTDYVNFFLSNPTESHSYSTWILDGAAKLEQVKGRDLFRGKLQDMLSYYQEWERTHCISPDVFWSYDNRDAMEFSISGTKNGKPVKGIRPTLNSYLYAEAMAIAGFAEKDGAVDIAWEYRKKAERIKNGINEKLWDGDFYKAIHGQCDEDVVTAFENGDFSDVPREAIGYIPWMFSIPPEERIAAFRYLEDPKCFRSPVGYTTADMGDRHFLFSADHECLWNGYVWPFATSQILTALYTQIQNGHDQLRPVFVDGMNLYAKCHLLTQDGVLRPWIDEVLSPFENKWTSREILRTAGWPEEKGGVERGKDYNHSTFVDLVISGTVGVSGTEDGIAVSPSAPENWDYWMLENLEYHGRLYTVTYDKTGHKYGRGKGIAVTCH